MSAEHKPKELQDASPVTDNKNMPEWITPLISALGSMGGSYMLWIKPLQERMDGLTELLNDLKNEIKELKQENKAYKIKLDTLSSSSENKVDKNEYLPIKKSTNQGTYLTKRF